MTQRQRAGLAAALLLALCGCAGEQTSPLDPAAAVAIEAGAWPQNSYTAGLPIPPGTVERGSIDSAGNTCTIWLTGLTDEEFAQYLTALSASGFTQVDSMAEEIAGQDYVSTAVLLSDGERGLSIAYTPDSLGIHISFADVLPR